MISVSLKDRSNLSGDCINLEFPDKASYESWLDAHIKAEWNDYCQGISDGSLEYLDIQVSHPDGAVEHVK
jgi:hypothetical protein